MEADPRLSDAERRRSLLLEEYRLTVDLSKHDDNLRQQRINNFLTVNTVLIAVAGIGLAAEPPDRIAGAMVAVFVLFGLAVAAVWTATQFRNSEYVRLRRLQLRQLEADLGLSGFSTAHRVLNRHEAVQFGVSDQPHRVGRWGRRSSTNVENSLPVLVFVFWIVAGAVLETAIFAG